MAWCENENCKKKGLRKDDIEFCDTTGKVLCHGCYVLMHPGWKPPIEIVDLIDGVVQPPKLGYAFQLSNEEGLKAKVSYGQISVSVHIPSSDINSLIKV